MIASVINVSDMRKNFIVRNEPFQCLHCGFENAELKGSCRNHCRNCLYSRHVDDLVPGDRESTCQGLMKPIGLDKPKKGIQMIIHECLTCGKKMRNMVAHDDNLDAVIEIGLYTTNKNDD